MGVWGTYVINECLKMPTHVNCCHGSLIGLSNTNSIASIRFRHALTSSPELPVSSHSLSETALKVTMVIIACVSHLLTNPAILALGGCKHHS